VATLSAMAEKSSESLRRTTGRDYDEWFALLDSWGAPGRPFREISDFLTGEHGVSRWWAQKLIVEYEQLRGIRPPGARRGGTFTVTASKTVNVPSKRAFEAFVDPKIRRRWLPDARMRRRTSQPGRSARFDWGDGATRVNVTFVATRPVKTQVAIEHELLRDTATADKMKVSWRERLMALKDFLQA
jgi:hypothetical protein